MDARLTRMIRICDVKPKRLLIQNWHVSVSALFVFPGLAPWR
jgi:hypothetical protein